MKIRLFAILVLSICLGLVSMVRARDLLVIEKKGNIRSDPTISSADIGDVSPGDSLEVSNFSNATPFKGRGWFLCEKGWVWEGLGKSVIIAEQPIIITGSTDTTEKKVEGSGIKEGVNASDSQSDEYQVNPVLLVVVGVLIMGIGLAAIYRKRLLGKRNY